MRSDDRTIIPGTEDGPSPGIPSRFVAACGVAFITALFLVAAPDERHWFVVPVAICGYLTAIDAVDWLRGRIDVFDPLGVIGVLGLHFFWLAPLLHVSWDHWLGDVPPPPDWRPWLGFMAALNASGILVYRAIARRASSTRHGPTWRIDARRFATWATVILVFTALLQVWVYVKFEGVLGYISAFEAGPERFQGMGWIFALSESFPIVAMLMFAVRARETGWRPPWPVLLVVLSVFTVVSLLFGGLRGSRSNTVWSLFWAAGIIHFWIRPVTKSIVAIGVAFLLCFMYGYGFYKTQGLVGLEAVFSAETRESSEVRTGRTAQAAILQDLGRSDVQALILYCLTAGKAEFEYGWGRTYFGAAALVVPSSVWPGRPATKVLEGTEIMYGRGSYRGQDRSVMSSSRVYGLAGESMLNFGPTSVPMAFAFFGWILFALRRWLLAWDADDARLLLYPFLVNLAFVALVSDSDNVVFFVAKYGVIPAVLLFATTSRVARTMGSQRAIDPTPGRVELTAPASRSIQPR